MSTSQIGAQEHPQPRGSRVRLQTSLLVLAAGPAAWIFQLIVDFGVASNVCRQNGVLRAAPPAGGWAPESLFLVGVNLACLAVALAGGFAALAAWRRARAGKPGDATELVEVGEERARFLAECGMMTAAVFAVAILFDIVWPFFVPSCWRFTP